MLIHHTRIAALLLAAMAAPALADDRPALRAEIAVETDIVTIGDLFDNAGARAGIPLFRAPDLGRIGSVRADLVIAAAALAGLDDIERGGITQVSVTRPSRIVTSTEVADMVKTAIAANLAIDPRRLDLAFDIAPEAIDTAPRSPRPVEIATLSLGQDRRFAATLSFDKGDLRQRIRLTGMAVEMVDVVTATRTLARGEIVGDGDVTLTRLPARQVVAGAAGAAADIVGLSARRALQAGQPLVAGDFAPPILVNRGDMVHIVYRSGALSLSADGRALASGAKGSTISIMNLSSNRVIDGVVTASGTVEVRSKTTRIVAGNG
ncbi:MAG: flagellar basal body P-ring formation chaperone FlgA [Bauldia sp.]